MSAATLLFCRTSMLDSRNKLEGENLRVRLKRRLADWYVFVKTGYSKECVRWETMLRRDVSSRYWKPTLLPDPVMPTPAVPISVSTDVIHVLHAGGKPSSVVVAAANPRVIDGTDEWTGQMDDSLGEYASHSGTTRV